MPYTSYVGLPRSGKSYSVTANVIIPALKEKRKVYTNIPMNQEKLQSDFGMTVIAFDLKDIQSNPDWFENIDLDGAVIVMDELWRLWPSGMTAKNIPESHKSFLAEHGHRVGENGKTIEIVAVTQDLSQLASFCRQLIETTYLHTKLRNIGFSKGFRVEVYSGAVTGTRPPVSRRENTFYGKYSRDIYQYYISHTKSKYGAGNETTTDGRFSIFSGIRFKVMIFLFLLLCWAFWGMLNKTIDGYTPSKSDQQILGIADSHASDNGLKTIQSIAQNADSFLSKAESLVIVFNNGHFPDIDYRIKVVIGRTQTVLTLTELKALEYNVSPINECLIKLHRLNFNRYVLCESQSDNNSMFDGITADPRLSL